MKLTLLACLAAAFAATNLFGQTATPTASMSPIASPSPAAKEVAIIKTSEGEMVAEFWPDVAPTKNDANHSRWGTGDPGYKVKAEFNDKPHTRGVLSMARSQDPDSAGSQFFICHGTAKSLDHQYTAFGKLIKGDDVLEKIATTPTTAPDRPIKRMNVESVKIVPADSVK
jgi:peptidyl-prolyl cis-trans isomerase B (cyclophilin B)